MAERMTIGPGDVGTLTAGTKGRDWREIKAPRFKVRVKRGKVGAFWRSILARIVYASEHLHKCKDQGDLVIVAQCEDSMTADTWDALVKHELPGVQTSRLNDTVGFSLSVEQLQARKLPEREGKAVRVIALQTSGAGR